MFDFEYYPKSALAILSGCVVFLGVDAFIALASISISPMTYISVFVGSIFAASLFMQFLTGFQIAKNLIYFILPVSGTVFVMLSPTLKIDMFLLYFSFSFILMAGFFQYVLPRLQPTHA